jgi:serine/threonine-protein kinase
MASVYEAMDVELGIPIALKLFTCAETETLVSRFKRELMLARELTHDNIVRVFDIGTHEGQRFMTMELMQGADLRDHMDGPMDPGVARQYLEQACVGLHAAHLRGVIHRDIKPENFFVMHDGCVKVMDFGIARKATATSNLTAEGFTAGTPAYMAPEQIRDFGKVTHQCDVYALGVIAYEMLTGELPFYHEEAMKLMMMHLHDAPPLPSEYVPTIPAGVERVILHALEKDPKDRIKSCAEFADRLAEAFDANE